MSEPMTSPPSVRDSFSEAEWNTMATAPILCAAAMSFADKTGPWAMMKEMTAGAQSYAAGARQFTDSSLVTALSGSVNNSMFEGLKPEKGQSAAEIASTFRIDALDNLNQALDLVRERGTAADLDAYQQWVLSIAANVMTKEKSGSTLGFGGERVSSGEEGFFHEVKTALGITE